MSDIRDNLRKLGFQTIPSSIHHQLSTPALIEAAVRRKEGALTKHGAFLLETGKYTGRCPNDKFIVENSPSRDQMGWGEVNRPVSISVYDRLKTKLLTHLGQREVFVQESFAGADVRYRLPVVVITESASHALFSKTMFIHKSTTNGANAGNPPFTILHAPSCKADPGTDGMRSEVFIIVNFEERIVLIGGTGYAGEIKKSVFSIMNYLLPLQGVMPMHCSANYGRDKNDVALFFGLSGTGKTTLSADPTRTLIGDDEHGWTDQGVFNFEGGCYAKVIGITPQSEPEIYGTTKRAGTILENVVVDPTTGELDLMNGRITENTRAAYPINFIPNMDESGVAGHPKHLIMLTCDAFGVLPPVANLTRDQAMYHFLSGYTAKVAGTEAGVTEPKAVFSACFGAPFMPLPPQRYADLLGEKLRRHNVDVWLVNTGWSGGAYGVGKRMSLAHTRAILRAVLSGQLKNTMMRPDPIFGLSIPAAVADVPLDVLNPRQTWKDPSSYDQKAKEVASMFVHNFAKVAPQAGSELRSASPRV